jgi:hypothetical protein
MRKAGFKGIKLTLIAANGKHRELFLSDEAALLEVLRETYSTEAPVEITYADQSPIPREVIDRINRRLFPG